MLLFFNTLFFYYLAALLSVLLTTLSYAASLQKPMSLPALPVISLKINQYIINAEVAADEKARQQGLMGRRILAENTGMLFVFKQNARYCFWMKNTYLPLSIAFIDEAGVIMQMNDMQPLSEKKHCAFDQVQYALEVNQGWFAQKKIRVGDRVIFMR